jgi:hypothetical protein
MYEIQRTVPAIDCGAEGDSPQEMVAGHQHAFLQWEQLRSVDSLERRF